jgi:hypothetical protein
MIGKTKYRGDRPKCVYGVAPSQTKTERRKYGTESQTFRTISAAMKHVNVLLRSKLGPDAHVYGNVRVYKLCGRNRRRVVKLCYLDSIGRMDCTRW